MATESDNVNSGALGTLVAVGTIAFFGIALVITALVRAELAEEVEKKEVSADRAYRDLVAEQSAKLNSPAAYSDRARGLVSLPIDRAMELTVAGLVKDPNSATPPAPAGGAGGSAATGTGGNGGMGGAASATAAAGTGGGAPTAGQPAQQDGEAAKPAEEKKKETAKPTPGTPKPGVPGSPAAPAPIAPSPAPAAPAPAPNGQ